MKTDQPANDRSVHRCTWLTPDCRISVLR